MITTASPFIGMMAALSQRHFTRSPARIHTHTHTPLHLHTHNAASVCCKNSKCDPIVFQCVFLKILWRIISRYPNRIRTHLSHYTHTHTHRRRRRGELASLVTLFSTWHQHNFSFLIWWDTHDDTIRQSVVFVDKKRKMATRVEQIKMIFLLMDGKNKFFFFQLYVCVCVVMKQN
jgi:hypothetical protein